MTGGDCKVSPRSNIIYYREQMPKLHETIMIDSYCEAVAAALLTSGTNNNVSRATRWTLFGRLKIWATLPPASGDDLKLTLDPVLDTYHVKTSW